MIEITKQICQKALNEGRNSLLESEVYDILSHGGVSTPAYYKINLNTSFDSQVKRLGNGNKVVVKVESPLIAHKTEMGGVKIVANNPESILQTAQEILKNVEHNGGERIARSVSSILVIEFIEAEKGLGSELFMGLRWSPDMGHVIAMGFGGLDAEEMAQKFQPGEAITMFSPHVYTIDSALKKFEHSFAGRKICGKTREGKKLIDISEIKNVLKFFFNLANEFSNNPQLGLLIEDFEINPFFISNSKLVAVDAMMRFSEKHIKCNSVSLTAIKTLLEPKNIAIIGVSNKDLNFGRVILRNLIREKFPLNNIRIIRENATEIDGIQCCPTIASLPWTADLFVVAVAATQIPELLSQSINTQKVSAMLLVSGGMGETESGKELDARTRQILQETRKAGKFAPVLVGPNCLGIRSRPGHYDTLFIPETKFPLPEGKTSNLAIVSQSGAFMITRMDALSHLDPKYSISIGNQMDLSHTDFVEALVTDSSINCLGIYIEGFKPLDGLRLAKIIRENTRNGKDFIVYKAGRTAEGINAASSHTASISSDYNSCVEVLRDAGALIAETFDEFKAYLTISSLFSEKEFAGLNLGLLSNAGFETVGMADNVLTKYGSKLAKFSVGTLENLKIALEKGKLASLVGAHNPLDVTPGASDEVIAKCVESLCADEKVHAVVAGLVPMTSMMKTLPPGKDPQNIDSIENANALPALLSSINKASKKPIIAVVDAGKLYDAFVNKLELSGIPCFRSADFALQILQKYLAFRSSRK